MSKLLKHDILFLIYWAIKIMNIEKMYFYVQPMIFAALIHFYNISLKITQELYISNVSLMNW